ncbi:unnamed protein product [Rotaria sordida]|uniref:Uncharacterized protein n=1 Tax=Rotaria sordida TaxID=392033 RepID=A0A814K4K2_9BILA|nr:unnamed protein product [Rotaria sordida]
MLIGTIAALGNGAAFPLMLLMFGNMTDVFTDRSFDLCKFNFTELDQFCPPGVELTAQNFLEEYKKCNFSGSNFTIPENQFTTKIREQALWLVIIGGATMLIGYFQVAFWSIACERQTRRLREILFRSILNKEISYFDINKTGELNTRLTEDINKVHDGIGDKISSALQFFATFIGGMALGFIKGWKLTLVVLSVSPILFGGAVILVQIIAKATSEELKSYAKAGAVAEEVFSSIRTVFSYNGANYESESLGQAVPHLQALAQARGAAYTLWLIIDTPSKIVSDSESGIKTDDLIGDVQFTNVNFVYPSRPDVPVHNGLSFSAQQGETIALVGTSGCGKSTCMQLLQRFYDPVSGSVMIGGHRVNEYHLGWLRQHIGVVSQEPILFQTTIAENIRLGRLEATQQEIEDAARIANAHDFIMTLPQKYDTLVGERGAQMSGGQKQRIAIARALIRDPRILLLDEATSALDTESESIVQDALNRASKGNHQSLMNLKGNYYGLVESQNLRTNMSDETELEDENEDDLTDDKKDSRTASLGDDVRNPAETTFEERQNGQTTAQDDKNVKVFQECDLHAQEKRVNFYVIIFVGLGGLMLITMFLQTFFFTISGEALTQRLRAKIFRLLLRQEIAYFDQLENSTGALCTRLSTEASAVQGDKKALEEAGKIAVEAISNIRTVAQLVKEPYFGDEYCKLLDIPLRNSLRRAHVFAILFSFTNSIMFFAQAALFTFGGWMVDRGSMTFENVMLVLNCLLFGAMAVGQTASLSPDYSKAIDASKHILALFERTPEIDNGATDGDTFENFKGEINFVDLQFRYPNRPEVPVLKRFNLNIKPHQQVALVGASGCGKSTTIQLIERFYNPTSGQLLIDHHDVSSLNLQWWRSKIGFVSQEPILFDASIRENIAYGDTSRYVTMAEICEAAKNANIHRFIETLPEQYETNVGAKGTQLSGGEKQRIAIARALIRNPSILLLDEATSALDTESERIVQDALDRASKGRTTIVIAHRLSTIQNSDVICVLHRGRIVEQGIHDDLLARKGLYYRLAQAKK